ncbi:OmpA family protein [Aestuariirhabdus sp. Z084]|uniref:OmpA family protein n=1 Tax=Aestuariirhabdus haliotis TaxID=2918751 RepID=UPI0020C184AC|nr:OmpA family protein [Aestuariirhabdus haliotis]MCL6417083.1 OmpA family protein [Aestuariirhabdus haliotis]
MKKAIVLSSLLLTATLPSLTMAEESSREGIIGIGSGALIGGLVAGPFGVVIGSGIGHALGESVNEAEQAETKEILLGEAQAELQALRQQLADSQQKNRTLEIANATYESRLQFEGLQLEVMFQTAATDILPATRQRLSELAQFLKDNPAVNVQLDGYADERGGEAYNHSLSLQRTNSIEDYLIDHDIDPARIHSRAHGKQLSQSSGGNPDLQALDRRVSIELSVTPKGSPVASRK